ncbi:hypothetical protein [Nocardia sp. alder85J]|uniref:hypothetical protein n=1 Tax=Nocardia sp. alder85J TaxID=2862949 RepID=UPI001CD19F35|nr:hypothetical protein [Nocardia sp. alder85J]MCX4099074.1 hypothetical protein [Nocardia sp. alder85J]
MKTDERDRIRAAMDRILSGAADRSNGALTIVALALKADVPRNALTQRHTDLKNEFYARVAERGAPSEVETQLRATIAALKKTIANKNTELSQFRVDVPALVRAVNQLALETRRCGKRWQTPMSGSSRFGDGCPTRPRIDRTRRATDVRLLTAHYGPMRSEMLTAGARWTDRGCRGGPAYAGTMVLASVDDRTLSSSHHDLDNLPGASDEREN